MGAGSCSVPCLEMESSPTQEQVGMGPSVRISKINELVTHHKDLYLSLEKEMQK